jgi:hypothetical protein
MQSIHTCIVLHTYIHTYMYKHIHTQLFMETSGVHVRGSPYIHTCINTCIHRERGTVYGNIGGAREGLVAVARGVGNGKAVNAVNRRGLKCAPVGLWEGKG